MSKNIFREFKRIVSQHFERRYWYEWRKIPHYWFNDDTNKYEDSSYPKNAKTIMNSTWEGEYDLWTAMLLKLDHMFWNLRKYGWEKKYYFYSNDIKKYGTKEDREYIVKSSLRKHFEKPDHLFLFNVDTTNLELSKNGLIHFNIKVKNNDVTLYAEFDDEIPQNLIPKNKKLYSLEVEKDENGKTKLTSKLAKQYKSVVSEMIYTWHNTDNEDIADFIFDRVSINFNDAVSNYLKTTSGDIKSRGSFDIQDILIELLDTSFDCNITDISKLSKGLKEHAVGNFVKCKDILHLRHLIKNMLKIDDHNDKYYNMWKDVEDDDERFEKLKEAEKLYLKDRKDAYQKITDFMCEKSPRWWD